jgi:hypothetical protein
VRVEVADRQVVEKVQLLLSKGAVITGRIVDDLGDPAMNVTVQALRFAYRDGVRQLSPARGALYSERTDDRGEFRLYGLVPGDYYISAKPANIGGMRQQPLEQGAATTFYPGTQDVVEARRVRAVAGRETGPLAFALGTTRLARVRGFAFGSSGTPLRGTVSIAHRDPFGSGSSSFGGTIRPDGSFEFNSVPPGAYVVTARDVDAYNSTPLEQGSIRITVAGQDIDGLSVFAAKEAVLRGRVVTDDGSPLPSAVQRARLEVVAADPAEGYSGWQNNAVLNEDGTFEVKGLFGRRRLVLGRVLDWQTRETRANGEDVTDTGIEFDSGEVIEDVEIVLTRKVTTVSGAVTDRFGTAVPRATVVLFSENERLWLPNSRFIRTSTTGEKGTYRLTGAPPSNDYLAVAVTGIEDGQWTDPEFLRALKEVGTRVRLKEGESKTLDLKVAERR